MTSSRHLLGALACAAALLIPAAAAGAATPGVNVSLLSNNGDPYVALPGNMPGDPSDTARTWQDLQDSGARTLRSFAQWTTLRGPTRAIEMNKFRQFADKANARGMRVVLTLTGDRASMASPSDYAAVAADLATQLKGKGVSYEVWNEEDDTIFWADGPQPAAYAALLKAAYPAIKRADPAATVLVGGLVGNDFDFLERLYDNGAKGSFDAVAVHTDTACLTTDPREYYREPSGRVGRYSFTGYREVHATMLAHGDDKPIWMSELGWSTSSKICSNGQRAGTKPTGVAPALQADFLTKAYGCLAGDPYVHQAAWFNSHDLDPAGDYGLVQKDFTRKPAFFAFQRAGASTPIPCGGAVDQTGPQVRILAPTAGQRYLTTLPVSIQASDEQGVRHIYVSVDGQAVPRAVVIDGTGASMNFQWYGAKSLSYGPHTMVVTARDAAQNVGRTSVQFVHVGGGAYPYTVTSKLSLKLGKRHGAAVKVSGKVTPKGNISPQAHGRVHLYFQRLDARTKRWQTLGHYARNAMYAFSVRYTLPKHGVWRVLGKYYGVKNFRNTSATTPKLKF